MELTKGDIKITKGVAILFMLLLHLFCRKELNGLYETILTIRGIPAIYYLALFGDACVPMYCFASGYGLYMSHGGESGCGFKRNFKRIFRLLINFWVVLVIFVIIGVLAGKADLIPGTPAKFLLNFFVLSYSYNGAWWFLQTYIILVFLAPLFAKLVNKYSPITLLLVSGIVYLLSYIQRIKHVLDLGDNAVLYAAVNALVLVGTSQLPFLIGSIFASEKIYSKLYSKFYGVSCKNALCAGGILALVLIHSVFESMIIAPFTGIAFICLFNLMNKSPIIQKILNFFGVHSTNLWLTHMFFYITLFRELTFAPKYPVLIFGWLIILCLVTSYMINFIYRLIIRLIDRKYYKDSKTKVIQANIV